MAAFIFFISIKLLSIPNAILFLIVSSVKNIFCEREIIALNLYEPLLFKDKSY